MSPAWGVGVGGFPAPPYPGGAQSPPFSQGTPRTCGFFLGRPRPLFSATSFSPLEARGWLDLALDSLIVCPSRVRRSGREEGQSNTALARCDIPQPSPWGRRDAPCTPLAPAGQQNALAAF